MPLRAAVLALALLSLTTVAGRAAQEPQAAQPTFRSTVDLVPVDVNVIDKDGRPVAALAAGTFALSADGKPRRIASAQFISVTRSLETPPPQPREYDSNSGAAGGRLVMLVIDSGNIAARRGRPAIQAARRVVGALNPADRVALVTIPGAGPQIDFTSNRAIVQTLLDKVVGQGTETIGTSTGDISAHM